MRFNQLATFLPDWHMVTCKFDMAKYIHKNMEGDKWKVFMETTLDEQFEAEMKAAPENVKLEWQKRVDEDGTVHHFKAPEVEWAGGE